MTYKNLKNMSDIILANRLTKEIEYVQKKFIRVIYIFAISQVF